MAKFELRTETVEVRDETFVVRELTHGERVSLQGMVRDDSPKLYSFTLAAACVEPKLTEEEVMVMPGSIVNSLMEVIARLSGIGDKAAPAAE